MDVETALHQFLVLYTWFPLAALLVFLLLIARFYQRFSKSNTFYPLYIAAVVIFGALAIRQAGIPLDVQDWPMGLLSLLAAAFLLFPALRLAHLMLRQKTTDD